MSVRTLAALAAATTLILAACTGSTGASTAPTDAPSNEASSPASAAPSASASVEPSASASAAAAQELAVDGKEFAYELPSTIPSGPTRVTLNNVGQEEHQAQIAKLNEGTTVEAFTAALQDPDPTAVLALVSLVGGPTGVAPGASVANTVDLQPGTHMFLCFVAGADGIPHLAKGMVAPLEVTEPASTAALPAGDAEVSLQDFSFVGLDTLTPGPHTVTVANKGPQPHEATIVKLADGVTVPDLLTMMTSGQAPAGPPPFTGAGGIAGISSGGAATMDVDLPAGNYAFICFVPDPATGKAHAELGMIGPLTIQ